VGADGGDGVEGAGVAVAKGRLEMVQRKLRGEAPTAILIDELMHTVPNSAVAAMVESRGKQPQRTSSRAASHWQDLQDIVTGERANSLRSELLRDALTRRHRGPSAGTKGATAMNGDGVTGKGVVLSVSDQARSLVDLATDSNVLGRAFIGWAPWV